MCFAYTGMPNLGAISWAYSQSDSSFISKVIREAMDGSPSTRFLMSENTYMYWLNLSGNSKISGGLDKSFGVKPSGNSKDE